MASNNRVDIEITAEDRASGVIANLQRNLGGMGGMANIAQVALGSLASAGVVAGLQAISSAVGKITSGLAEAAQMQTQLLTAANSVSINLKVNLPEAEEIQKKLNQNIAIAAATQPGNNADYVAISNTVASSIAKAYQGKPKEFLDATTNLVKGAGLLASSSGIDAGSAGSTISRFINGTTGFNALKNIDFFEKNPILVQKLEEAAKSQGLSTEQLQKWTQSQRVDIFNTALGSVVTPEFLSRLNNTAEAKMQSMQATLFDQNTGIFGFLRDIDSLGGISVLDTFNNFLTTFGVFSSTIKKLQDSLGIAIDPMELLGNGINYLNDVLVEITEYLNGFSLSGLQSFDLASFGSSLGVWFSERLRSMIDTILTFDSGGLAFQAADFVAMLVRTTLNFIDNVDFGVVFKVIVSVILGLSRHLLYLP